MRDVLKFSPTHYIAMVNYDMLRCVCHFEAVEFFVRLFFILICISFYLLIIKEHAVAQLLYMQLGNQWSGLSAQISGDA